MLSPLLFIISSYGVGGNHLDLLAMVIKNLQPETPSWGRGGQTKTKNKQTKGGLVILISLPLISHSRHKPAVSTAERKGQLVLSLCMQMCAFV